MYEQVWHAEEGTSNGEWLHTNVTTNFVQMNVWLANCGCCSVKLDNISVATKQYKSTE